MDKLSRLILTLMASLWLATTLLASTSQEGFQPFDKSLRGLEELFFVKQAIQDQVHKGPLTKISASQAVKSLKPANVSLGLEYSDRVQDFLDFYTSQPMRKGVEIMLGLSESYMPVFESYLVEEKMPADLMYLPMALSSLNTKTVSDWGASGLWQLMYTSGKLYNLQIDSYVDERRDPVKSTKAALHYLKDLYAIYNSWELAIAAYSSSPSNVNKAIRKSGGSKKYADLYPWLPVETRDYLPAFAACYILMQNYEKAGLKPFEIASLNYSLRTPVEHRVHLDQIAEVLSIPSGLLHDMNPEYKSHIIPAGNGKAYSIRLPIGKQELFTLYADSIFRFRDTVYFPPGESYIKSDIAPQAQDSNALSPANVIQPEVQPNPQPNRNKTKLTYTVKDGDNLGYISGWYNVSLSDLRSWNNLRGDVIKVGQVLDIWVPDSRAAQYKGIDEMTFAQKQKTGSSGSVTPAPKPNTRAAAAGSSAGYTWYTVKRGDNPTSIAAKYPGVTANEILKLNNISDPRNLKAGEKIKIPKK